MSTTLTARTRAVTIYQGDDLADLEEMRAAIASAQAAEQASSAPRMLADAPAESGQMVVEYNAKVEDAKSRAVQVKVQNIGRRVYHDLKVAHPPRDGEQGDENIGCNEDTFFDALLPLTLVAPQFDSSTERDRFLEDLSPVDWERVKLAAFQVNETASADPKPFPAFAPTSGNVAT